MVSVKPTPYLPWEQITRHGWHKTAHKFTAGELVQWFQRVPIDNNDPEYTCVSWVEGALKMLRDAGTITSDDYERGMDGMMGAILEATQT